MVELTEVEVTIAIVLQVGIALCMKEPVHGELPIGGRQPLECPGRKAPEMRCQLIETLVIQRRHHHGIHRFIILRHRECPLLLLSWSQSVAEGLPLQLQFLVWQGSADGLLIGMTFAVLHPGKGTKDTVAPFLLIYKLTVDERIRLVDEALLYHLVS